MNTFRKRLMLWSIHPFFAYLTKSQVLNLASTDGPNLLRDPKVEYFYLDSYSYSTIGVQACVRI